MEADFVAGEGQGRERMTTMGEKEIWYKVEQRGEKEQNVIMPTTNQQKEEEILGVKGMWTDERQLGVQRDKDEK